jgi:hypothetical protein
MSVIKFIIAPCGIYCQGVVRLEVLLPLDILHLFVKAIGIRTGKFT